MQNVVTPWSGVALLLMSINNQHINSSLKFNFTPHIKHNNIKNIKIINEMLKQLEQREVFSAAGCMLF